MAKGEFTAEQVLAGLTVLGFNTENRLKVLEYRDQFDNTELGLGHCRNLVGKVQGADAAKSDTPVSLERYRKRVMRMFDLLKVVPADTLTPTIDKIVAGEPAETGKLVTIENSSNSSSTTVDAGTGSSDNGSAMSEPEANSGTADQTKETTMATKKKAAKKAKAPKADKAPKGPGVIDTIVSVLEGGGGTVADIAAKVHKKFPDRKLDGLTATVKIQVSRLMTPKNAGGRGLKIIREKQEGTNALVYSIKAK